MMGLLVFIEIPTMAGATLQKILAHQYRTSSVLICLNTGWN